jgi:hypothetical protein
MSNPNEPEIIPPDPLHAYDREDIAPKDFLLAVMRDRRIPLQSRMEAAAKVAVYEHPRLAQTTQDLTAGVKIIIEGGLPTLPGTNIIMPGQEAWARKANGGSPPGK